MKLNELGRQKLETKNSLRSMQTYFLTYSRLKRGQFYVALGFYASTCLAKINK